MKNIRLTTILILATAFLSNAAYSAPGDLDTAFSGDGKAILSFGVGDSEGRASAIQSDGKIIVVGNAMFGSNRVFALIRYNSDGSLDTTFDGDGKVFTDIEFGAEDFASAVAIQTDGKIIVAGSSANTSPNIHIFAVVRYNTDGTLDTTFDSDGKLTTAFVGGIEIARGIAIQSDGKIVVVGRSGGGGGDFAVARYNTDGSLDPVFDTDGKVTTNIDTGFDEAYSVAIQSDGKLVVAGTGHTALNNFQAITIVRYNTNGSLDNSFSVDGKVITPAGSFDSAARGLALQPSDGKIVITGNTWNGSNFDFVTIRYNTDGSQDSFVQTAIGSGPDIAAAVKVQPDGKIVIAGETAVMPFGVEDFAAVRYNADFTLDTTFSFDGKALTNFGARDKALSLALQSDGGLILVGNSQLGPDFQIALLRYDGNGELDVLFDGDGMVTTQAGTARSALNAVDVQSDGKIVAAGFHKVGADIDFLVARFNADGTLDTTFDGDGVVTTDFGGTDDKAKGIAVQSDGKIVVAGGRTISFALSRYNADGSLDTTFDGDGKVTTQFIGGFDQGANALAIQPDGRIVIAGFARLNSTIQDDIRVIRYNTDGSQNGASAGTDILGGDDTARAIALQSDGKIVVASNGFAGTNQDFAVVRYNADLTTDNTFSGDGIAFVDFGPGDDLANSVAVQSDGKIVAAGSASNGTNTDFGVARLSSNGSLDTSFSGDGRNTTAIGSGTDVANALKVQPDGKIIAGGFGFVGSSNNFASVRYKTDGTLDSTLLWGTGGIATSDLGSDDKIKSIAIQTDGKVVAAGESGGSVAIARYLGLGPSAAGVVVSGRVLTTDGRGISKVRLTITDPNGVTKITTTGSFGYYRFDSIESGETYVLSVQSKRFTFASPTKVISVTDDLSDVDFIANE